MTIAAQDAAHFFRCGQAGHLETIRSIAKSNGKNAFAVGIRAGVNAVRTAAACGSQVMFLINGAQGISYSRSLSEAQMAKATRAHVVRLSTTLESIAGRAPKWRFLATF